MPVNRFKNYSPAHPHLVRPGGLKGEVQDLRKDLDNWSIEVSNAIDAGTGGITELTGDVTTAVGTGSQAATVEGLQGNPVSAAAPSVSDVLTWSGTEWAPAAGGGGGGVTSVGGTAPIASSGGATPTISITAATPLADGSMSAADKAKLDGITTIVTSVSASAPLASSGGTTPDISISAGTTPGDVMTWDGANWAGAAPTGGGTINGTIAANEVAFGTAPDTIGGSAQLEWNPGTNSLTVYDPTVAPVLQVDATSQINGKVTVTGGTVSCFSIVSSVDGEFVSVDPSLFTVTVKDALSPVDFYTNISPSDVTVADNPAQTSGQVNAQGVQAFDAATTNFAALRVVSGVPTLLAQDTTTVTDQPLNVVVGELQINANPGAAGEVLTSNGPGVAPTWQAGGGGGASLALTAVRVATAAPLPANSYAAGVLTASSGGLLNTAGIDGVTTLALGDRVLVKDEAAALENQVYTITDLGASPSGPQVPAVPAPPTFSGALLTCGSGGTYATLTAAVAAAAPGDRIQILPGTIVEAAAVAVNKSLEIFGTGATCIVQRDSTTSVLAVTASDVYLHDFKVVNNQLASADPGGQSACVNAETMNRTSLGGATGLYFANLTCEQAKAGIFVSGTSWVVRDCAFSPSAANTTASTTLRSVFCYGSEGTSFINDCTFLTTLDNARLTAIYLNTRNDGIAPAWESGYKGDLVIDGNVINDAGGAPRSYIDATSIYHQSGTATTAPPNGEFSLYIANNDFSLDHQSSPCVFFGRSYGATPVAPLSFFLNLVVTDNLFGAREASVSQKGALFWTSTSGSGVSMGALVGGFYGANNTIDPMVLPATNTSIMADSSLLMVRENAFYSAPSPLLTLVPLDPGLPWELTVAADFVSAAARGVFTSVNEGTANAETSWIVVTPDPITLGTTGLTWDLFGTVSVVGVANGGTGLTATPTNGQIPIGNGSGYTLATLTAGAGIAITNGAGSVTVATNQGTIDVPVALNGQHANPTPIDVGAFYFSTSRTVGVSSTALLELSGGVGPWQGQVTLTTLAGVTVATFNTGSQVASGYYSATLTPATPVVIPSGWYRVTLANIGSGTATALGLFLSAA